MRLIVGLGNPGRRYQHTPHNVGYDVADVLAARGGLKWRPARRLDAEVAEGTLAGRECLLVKPTTYMNASGEVVGPLARAERLNVAADLLVVSDDVALPLGRLRVRAWGSSGGHRGMESLIGHLGTTAFPRLRCGVAPQGVEESENRAHEDSFARRDLAAYVLSKWPRAYLAAVEAMCDRAANAAEEWLAGDLADVMTRYNRG